MNYRYALRGDGQLITEPVPPATQRHALASLLKTLDASFLMLPEPLLRILPPRPPAYPRTRESFPSNAGLAFDPVAMAQSAADLTLMAILHPARAQRLTEDAARDPQQPDLNDVLDAVIAATWNARSQAGLAGNVQEAIQLSTTEFLLALAVDPHASELVRATVRQRVMQLKPTLAGNHSAAAEAALARIALFEQHPETFKPRPPLPAPPGMPIGSADDDFWLTSRQ